MLTVLPKTRTGFVFAGVSPQLKGIFHFGSRAGQVVKTRGAIWAVIYRGARLSPTSWLKDLFLAKRVLLPTSNSRYNKEAFTLACNVMNLNTLQIEAVRQAVIMDAGRDEGGALLFSEARQSICQGLPGTGKLQVIVCIDHVLSLCQTSYHCVCRVQAGCDPSRPANTRNSTVA